MDEQPVQIVKKRRIKVIPIFLMHFFFGLGIAALGTFAKNVIEQIGGAVFMVVLMLMMFVVPSMFQCTQVMGVSVGGGCVARTLLSLVTLLFVVGSYAYIIARIVMLRKKGDVEVRII